MTKTAKRNSPTKKRKKKPSKREELELPKDAAKSKPNSKNRQTLCPPK